MEETKTRKWRWGVNRWIVLALIGIGVWLAILYPPIQPHVQLAAEHVSHDPILSLPVLGDIYLTNTMVAMVLVDIILIIFANPETLAKRMFASFCWAGKSLAKTDSSFCNAVTAVSTTVCPNVD